MNQTFDDWMARVDLIIAAILSGLTSEDLTDVCYRDMYDAGETPRQAARCAIRESGGLE